jgi:hypothetical protein
MSLAAQEQRTTAALSIAHTRQPRVLQPYTEVFSRV